MWKLLLTSREKQTTADARNEHDQHKSTQDVMPLSPSALPLNSHRPNRKSLSSSTDIPSSDAQTNENEATAAAFKPVYPYPENKDVVVWESRDPKRSMTTTVSTLDTRANTSSGSIMSRTRRIMDQQARQRQMDIERDFSGQSERMSPAIISNKSIEGVNRTDDSFRIGSHKSSQRGTSPHISFRESTSPMDSPTQKDRGASLSFSKNKNSSNRKYLQRALAGPLSGPIFISNPRGVAPTPSPDVSLELVRGHSKNKGRQAIRVQERMKRYETQLDQRNEAISANNRRLMELKLLLEGQNNALVLLGQNGYDEDYDDEEEWEAEQLEREREKAQLEEANVLLGNSQILQQQLKMDLEKEQTANKNLNLRIQELSIRLKDLLDLSEAQTKELKQVRQQAGLDREQWEQQISEEKRKHDHIHISLTNASSKEMEMTNELSKQRSANLAEVHKLTSEIDALNQYIQEIEGKIRRSENKTQTTASKQVEQTREYQTKIQLLEKQLAVEQGRLSEDQEARSRVRVKVKELAQSVEQKEDEVRDLRDMLEERDEHLDRRQTELDDALSLVRTLKDQLREQQLESQESQKQEQEKHAKELRQQRAELKQKLSAEMDSRNQLERRIQILLESHQESSQISEAKIRQLEEDVEKRTVQLSQFNSNSSSAASNMLRLQGRIEEQERILVEKEDRIQELEQERKLDQQQAQRVVADLEHEMLELEDDRSKLENLLQKAHKEEDDAVARVKELELHLNHKDHEFNHELSQRYDRERQLLERLLADMETMQVRDDQDDQHQDSHLNNDSESADGSVQYYYSRLQDKARELKQEYLHQNQVLVEMRQQLDQCNSEIDSQQEQIRRMESGRKSIEKQLSDLQDELGASEHNQHQLRQQLQKKEQEIKEARASSKAMSSSTSQKQNHHRQSVAPNKEAEALELQIQTLKEQSSLLKDEKQQLARQLEETKDQLQALEETIDLYKEAAQSVKLQYSDLVEKLEGEVEGLRKTAMTQEGQLFLYLSVIEKLNIKLLQYKKKKTNSVQGNTEDN
ncbi:hypothetical protein BGZ76_001299 [Entomortierella beljakovae]|nr:hypothetical protein BGZ76_001299 [Entomortierella beljakovae]